MSIIIRKATAADAPGFAAVHVRAWQESYRGLVPQPFLDAMRIEPRARYWGNTLASPSKSSFFVALVDDIICGIAGGGPARDADLGTEAELLLVYVLESAKGKGLGRLLMGAVADALLAQGLKSTGLWVLKGNPACGFYEHLGGVQGKSKVATVGGAELQEVAYTWSDVGVCKKL